MFRRKRNGKAWRRITGRRFVDRRSKIFASLLRLQRRAASTASLAAPTRFVRPHFEWSRAFAEGGALSKISKNREWTTRARRTRASPMAQYRIGTLYESRLAGLKADFAVRLLVSARGPQLHVKVHASSRFALRHQTDSLGTDYTTAAHVSRSGQARAARTANSPSCRSLR